MKRLGLVALLGVAAAGSQAAIVFDFEEFAPTSGGALTTLSSTRSGITMSLNRSSGVGFDIKDTQANLPSFVFPVSWDQRSLDPFANFATNDFFVATFSAGILQADVEMTDFGGDSDTIVMEAYSGANGTGTLLGTSTLAWGTQSGPDYGAVSFRSTTVPILSIRFRGESTVAPNGMYIDNIAVAVPEPMTIAGLALGVGLVARRRRRA